MIKLEELAVAPVGAAVLGNQPPVSHHRHPVHESFHFHGPVDVLPGH